MDKERPKVGIGIVIKKDGKVLLGKRKGAHGVGTWSLPGGHLEFGETWADCAEREVAEEVGVKFSDLKFGFVTNDIFIEEGKHYITIFLQSDFKSGEPEILEPEKCDGWDWFSWGELPKPLFLPLENAINQGYDPFKI